MSTCCSPSKVPAVWRASCSLWASASMPALASRAFQAPQSARCSIGRPFGWHQTSPQDPSHAAPAASRSASCASLVLAQQCEEGRRDGNVSAALPFGPGELPAAHPLRACSLVARTAGFADLRAIVVMLRAFRWAADHADMPALSRQARIPSLTACRISPVRWKDWNSRAARAIRRKRKLSYVPF